MEPFQCRGVEGKLAKDVGVVIIPSDKYIDCGVEINCPHYIRHPLNPGRAAEHGENAGCCRASKYQRCLYDKLDGSKI